MNQSMRKLFDSLRDGVVIVSAEGLVRYANQAAVQGLSPIPGKLLPSESIRHQVRAAWQGYVKLPLTLEVDAPNQNREVDRLRVTLMQSPVGEDYVVVMHNVTEAQFYEHTVNNLAEILNQELNVPFQALARSLEELMGQLGAAPNEGTVSLTPPIDPEEFHSQAEKVIATGAGVIQRLNQLVLMSETFSHSPMLEKDRIVPRDLVSEVLLLAKPALAARRIRVSMVGVDDNLPGLYGSRRWLPRALAEHVQHMAANAKNDADLLLTVKGGGNFIIFHFNNCGRGIPAHLKERAFLPFHKGSESQDVAGLGLGLALCKRVVDLHKGHIRFVENDGEISELIIELPAGGMAQEQDTAAIEQAQRYAQDLARLMQRASLAA